MPDYNSMQANLGLIPGMVPPQPIAIKSPAQVAAELSAQATANLQYGASIGPQVARNLPQVAAMGFGQQFQQQFQQAQGIQSFNPYVANMMGAAGGYGGGQMNLPSPIMMTPASTGVFRPPSPAMGMQPIPPMPVMPVIQTPFTPQLPRPMFQIPWEQEMQQRDYRADAIYSYAIQAPRAGGMMAGLGAGALAGAAMGRRFGAPMMGAAVGMLGAGVSGMAGGLGDMAMMPFRPGIEARQMGASFQRMSQDWVVGGSQLHPSGSGFTRQASVGLAQGVMDLTEDKGFQRQTGGMFSRSDMANMLQTAGRSGLMDFTQNTDQVREQLRKTAISVKKFMELTNDPDVNNIIRRMADMQRVGYSMNDMDMAARGMRRFARGAGTTIDGIMQMGGAGAMTYQGVGLSGAAGMQYGMYSAMMARQSINSGVYSPAEAALMGGQSGIAQRNMQVQAAFMSMPLVGASMASFNGTGWGVNYGQVANQMTGQGGATGLVTGAAGNLGRAFQQGGAGAIAMYPLQAKFMQDEIARAMSPEQQTMMRYMTALSTGKQLGFKGAGAFAAGARLLYGDENATQMLKEASSPQYFKSMMDNIRQQQQQLAREQYADIKSASPGAWGAMGQTFKSSMRDAFRTNIGSLGTQMAQPLGRFMDEWGESRTKEAAAERGEYYYEQSGLLASTLDEQKAMASNLRTRGARTAGGRGEFSYRGRNAYEDLVQVGRGNERNYADTIGTLAGSALSFATFGLANEGTLNDIVGSTFRDALPVSAQKALAQKGQAFRERESAALIQAKEVKTTGAAGMANFKELERQLGLSSGSGSRLLALSGGKFAGIATSTANLVDKDRNLGTTDAIRAAALSLIQIDPKLAELAKKDPKAAADAAVKKFMSLDPEMKKFVTAGTVKQGVASGSALVAERVASSEISYGTRKAGWESVQADLKGYQKEIDTLTEAMGLSGGEAKKVQESLKGMTESEQMAVGMFLGERPEAISERDQNRLYGVIAKEMGETGTFDPKTGKMVYSSKVGERYLELQQGSYKGKMTGESYEALVGAQRRLGAGKFGGAIFGMGEAITGAQQVAGAGVAQDLMGGTTFDPTKFSLEDLDAEKVEKLRGKYPELAALGEKYLAAKKSKDKKGMATYGQSLKEGLATLSANLGGTSQAIFTPGGAEAQQQKASLDQIAAGAPQLLEALKNVFPDAAKDFAAGAKALAESQGKTSVQVNSNQDSQTTPK